MFFKTGCKIPPTIIIFLYESSHGLETSENNHERVIVSSM